MKKKYIKKIVSVILFAVLAAEMLLSLTSCSKDDVQKLYVYNWGEYIADGSDETEDIIDLFEQWYSETYGKDVEVVYSLFTCNEELYAKMQSNSTSIDVIIPSDYMVARMIREDMIQPLNFDNIPNMENIDDEFKDPDGIGSGPLYDPYCKYSVPYTQSYVGLIYNKNFVDESDLYDEDGNVIASWNLLWDEKYKGQILNFNNYRDAFGVAQYMLSAQTGHTTKEDNYVNTDDKSRWDEAADLIAKQHDVIQAYVMDEVFNKMESQAAAFAPYYVGDYYTMYDSVYDEDYVSDYQIDRDENGEITDDAHSYLGFVYPVEGTNVFVDAMCIPKAAKNKELAEIFINFMISTDVTIGGESYNIAKENAEYICYGTPVIPVVEDEEYDFYGDELLYPESDDMVTYYFDNLDAETLDYANSLWEKLKVESAPGISIYICAGVIWFILAVAGLALLIRNKKRAKEYS